TRRPSWTASIVFGKFLGTTLLLGATGGAVWAAWLAPELAPRLAIVATAMRTALFAWECALLGAARSPASPRHRGALVVWRLLRPVWISRAALFAGSTLFSILAIGNAAEGRATWAVLAWLTTVSAQVLERLTFFAASAPPRMPGGVVGR